MSGKINRKLLIANLRESVAMHPPVKKVYRNKMYPKHNQKYFTSK